VGAGRRTGRPGEGQVVSDVVRVKVVIYEDSHEVNSFEIGYFKGQEYVVELVTPDGVDLRTKPKDAGES